MDSGNESFVASELTVHDLQAAIKNTVARRRPVAIVSLWTHENVETLTRLWSQGYSATQITREIPGTTRSGILGKLHRMRTPKRERTEPRKRQKRVAGKFTSEKSFNLRVEPIPEPPPILDGSYIKPFMEAAHAECRFIVTPENCPTLVCGAPTPEASSWCPYHSGLVYAKPQRRKPRSFESKKPSGITLRAPAGVCA